MIDINPSSNASPTQQDTASRVERILEIAERGQRKRWVEIVCAVVLSLASLASAWCVYQSSRWNGVQTFRLDESILAGQDASRSHLAALQFESFDATMFMNFVSARSEGKSKAEEFLSRRFRPEMKVAMDAWLKTDPFQNPSAPSSPFKMKEYAQPERDAAKRMGDLAVKKRSDAEKASEISDTYVLLTVLFTAVLFFGGISGTFDVARLRQILTLIAIGLFTSTLIALATMQICHE